MKNIKWLGVGIMGSAGFIAAALASEIAPFVMIAVIGMSFFAAVTD